MERKSFRKILTLSLVVVLSLMITVMPVSATFNVAPTDIRNGVVTVSGTAAGGEGTVNIFVLNPGVTSAATPADIQHMGSVEAAADGSFTYQLPISVDDTFVDGTFTFYVGGNAYGAPESKSFYYVSFSKKLTAALAVDAAIIDLVNASEADKEAKIAAAVATLTDIVEPDPSNAQILSLNDAFFAVDTAEIVKALANYYEQTPIDFVTDDVAAVTELVDTINKLSYLQAFREGEGEVLFNELGNIVCDDVLGLTAKLDATTTLSAIRSGLGSGLISSINNSLLNVDIIDENDLAQKYAYSIILYALKNTETLGYDYIDDILTAANANYALLAIPNYLALTTGKSSANAQLAAGKAALNASNLATTIEAAATTSSNQGTLPPLGTDREDDDDDFGRGETVTFGPGVATSPADPIIPVTPVVPEVKDVFSDIAGFDWAKEAIENLAAKNIIAGTGDGSFNPEGQLTREQAAKIVCLALGFEIPAQAEGAFADEIAGAWYQPYLAAARANGIANGQGENLFGIGDSISRQDFAAMLYRALGVSETAELTFADAQDISDYAKDAVAYLAGKKVINGYTDGTFKPAASITRAEAAKLVYELIK